MLLEVLEGDDFLQVSSARRLVSISGTVRAIDLTLSEEQNIGVFKLK
jgi:hypothetical protein